MSTSPDLTLCLAAELDVFLHVMKWLGHLSLLPVILRICFFHYKDPDKTPAPSRSDNNHNL
jgi:hypothetical protein